MHACDCVCWMGAVRRALTNKRDDKLTKRNIQRIWVALQVAQLVFPCTKKVVGSNPVGAHMGGN